MNRSNTLMIKKVGILVYGRFPTEKAYGTHIVEVAKAFSNNNKSVTIFYSKTNNDFSIDESPETFYDIPPNIELKELNNYDFTKLRIFNLLPAFFKKFIWNFGAIYWSNRVRSELVNMDLLWSTNPNLLAPQKKLNSILIYEKHGSAKYFQRLSIIYLSRIKNVIFVSTSKTSFDELSKINSSKTIHLPNGVDLSRYNNKITENKVLNIGYIGMLETYGRSKGVEEAIEILCRLKSKYQFNITVIGGPENRIENIKNICSKYKVNALIKNQIRFSEVPYEMQKLDIGLIPYPNDFHMSLYASPLKFFEYAASGSAILCSDLRSHLELNELNLGVEYFEESNWDDFRLKIINLIEDNDYLKDLKTKSITNIQNYSWDERLKNLIEFSVRSSIG